MNRRDNAQPGQAATDASVLSGAFGKAPVSLDPGVDLRDIARRRMEQIQTGEDDDAARRLYADDVIDHNPAPNQRPGIAGLVGALHWLEKPAPDLTITVESCVAEGNCAAVRWVLSGTHTGTPLMGIAARGRPFRVYGMDVIRVRADGKITDVWHVEELLPLLAQIQAP